MEILTKKQARCKECNSEVSITSQGCFICFECNKLVNIYLQEKNWIQVGQVMQLLEGHRFCSEYHKIQSKDNPDEYYKESCLFFIHKQLKDALTLNSSKMPEDKPQGT